MTDLGRIALALPGVERGIACAGTALESRTYRTGEKAFLFVAKTQARLKLAASAGEARTLGFAVGASGWVTLPLDGLPASSVVKRWIAESHALLSKPAGKKAAEEPRRRRRPSGPRRREGS